MSLIIYLRFPNAVSDFRASLAYKQELYPKESEIIAEAHFKLSLALEFASITTTKEDGEEEEEKKETHVDEAMREEAAKELEAAISSTKMKLHFKEAELAESSGVDDNDVAVSQIAEVKEIVADMEQRVCYHPITIPEVPIANQTRSFSIFELLRLM